MCKVKRIPSFFSWQFAYPGQPRQSTKWKETGTALTINTFFLSGKV
jgi:hypothetical protein